MNLIFLMFFGVRDGGWKVMWKVGGRWVEGGCKMGRRWVEGGWKVGGRWGEGGWKVGEGGWKVGGRRVEGGGKVGGRRVEGGGESGWKVGESLERKKMFWNDFEFLTTTRPRDYTKLIFLSVKN